MITIRGLTPKPNEILPKVKAVSKMVALCAGSWVAAWVIFNSKNPDGIMCRSVGICDPRSCMVGVLLIGAVASYPLLNSLARDDAFVTNGKLTREGLEYLLSRGYSVRECPIYQMFEIYPPEIFTGYPEPEFVELERLIGHGALITPSDELFKNKFKI